MRLSELSERSGVSAATVKYYLREGLLPQGRRVTATRAEYGEFHLRRLRLVRALIQVGRVPVATAREVLAAVDDDGLGRTMRLGAALWALPHGPDPAPDDPAEAAAEHTVDALLEQLGWDGARELGDLSPSYRTLVSTAATLSRLGYDIDAAQLVPYARYMEQVAEHDLDRMERIPTEVEQVEETVASVVIFEPLLLNLRRLAQEEHSRRRYGL